MKDINEAIDQRIYAIEINWFYRTESGPMSTIYVVGQNSAIGLVKEIIERTTRTQIFYDIWFEDGTVMTTYNATTVYRNNKKYVELTEELIHAHTQTTPDN